MWKWKLKVSTPFPCLAYTPYTDSWIPRLLVNNLRQMILEGSPLSFLLLPSPTLATGITHQFQATCLALAPAECEPLEAGSGDGGGGKGVGKREKDYCQHLHCEGGGEGILAFFLLVCFWVNKKKCCGGESTPSHRRRIMLILPNLHWFSPKEEVQEMWNKTSSDIEALASRGGGSFIITWFWQKNAQGQVEENHAPGAATQSPNS